MVTQITAAESSLYLEHLRKLIRSTMKLPEAALSHYCNQWTAERITANLNNWLFLTANIDHSIEGVLLGTPVEGGVGTIIWVLVDTTKQKKGVGGQLFREACDRYRAMGAHKVKLTVPDRKTVNFYLKQGMQLEGEHKNHWWGADFWAMGKNL